MSVETVTGMEVYGGKEIMNEGEGEGMGDINAGVEDLRIDGDVDAEGQAELKKRLNLQKQMSSLTPSSMEKESEFVSHSFSRATYN
jgi:hypothetical protein